MNLPSRVLGLLLIFGFLSLRGYADHIQLVPNPEPLSFTRFAFAYHDSLYAIYGTKLARVDGDRVSVFANPGASDGVYEDQPTEYHGKMYFRYHEGTALERLAEFDGTQIRIIPFPNNRYDLAHGRLEWLIAFRDRLYFEYADADHVYGTLASYDGTQINFVAAPDIFCGNGCSPIIYKDRLYFVSASRTAGRCLAVFDGEHITVLKNPDVSGGPVNRVGVPLFIYNDKLYCEYGGSTGPVRLAEYDGSVLRAVPNLSQSAYKDDQRHLVFQGKLFSQYTAQQGLFRLAAFDGTKVSPFATEPNEPDLNQVIPALVANDRLYGWIDEHLVVYDGSRSEMIPGAYRGTVFACNNRVYWISLGKGYVGSTLNRIVGTHLERMRDAHEGEPDMLKEPFVYHNQLHFADEGRGYRKLGYLLEDGIAPTPRPNVALGLTGNSLGKEAVIAHKSPSTAVLTFVDANGEKQTFNVFRPKMLSANPAIGTMDTGGWLSVSEDKQSGYIFNVQADQGVTAKALNGVMIMMMGGPN